MEDDIGYNKIGEMIKMNFIEALEAMKKGQKVRRSAMAQGDYITFQLSLGSGKPMHKEPQYFKEGLDHWSYHRFSIQELEADDWEIVPYTPKVNSDEVLPEFRAWDEVLSEFKSWFEKSIHSSRGTPSEGNTYLIQCLDKLDELSSKPTQEITPERCTIILINGNKATVKTESGGYMIINLPSVEL